MLTKFQLILLPVALVFAEVSSKRCIGHGCNTKKRSLDNELDSCKPGSNWREDCNKCTCNELGQTVCTQWPCDPNQPELIFKKISVGRRSCNEGDLWFKDCNICVCHGLGRSVCTEYNCHKYNWVHNKLRKRRETGIKAGSTCTPGTTWKVDCNTCFCSETGYIGCTLRGCLSPYIWPLKDKKLCTPGTTWKEDCNTCVCSENGHVSCTEMACISDQIRPKRHQERTCTPGTTWKEDCNTCFCSETGHMGCTLMACPSHQNRPKRDQVRTCTPGATWKEDCNTCFCSENGHVGCTLMACPSHQNRPKRDEAEEEQSEVSLQELEKNCEIGTTVKLDCNICYCTAMGLACTRRLCHGQEVSVVVEE